jgi:hypothetical protein
MTLATTVLLVACLMRRLLFALVLRGVAVGLCVRSTRARFASLRSGESEMRSKSSIKRLWIMMKAWAIAYLSQRTPSIEHKKDQAHSIKALQTFAANNSGQKQMHHIKSLSHQTFDRKSTTQHSVETTAWWRFHPSLPSSRIRLRSTRTSTSYLRCSFCCRLTSPASTSSVNGLSGR